MVLVRAARGEWVSRTSGREGNDAYIQRVEGERTGKETAERAKARIAKWVRREAERRRLCVRVR